MEHVIADVAASFRGALHHWPTSLVNVGLMFAGLVGTCVFISLADATIKGELGFPHADRLRSVDAIVDGVEYTSNSISVAELPSIIATDVFDRVTVMGRGKYKLTLAEDRSRLYPGAIADSKTMEVLGIGPMLGRWFLPSDTVAGAAPVIVIGFEVWKDALGGDSSAVGASITVNGVQHEVIGIMPSGFAFPLHEQLWLPLEFPTSTGPNDPRRYAIFGTLRDGINSRDASLAIATAVRAAGTGTSNNRSAQVRPIQLSAIGGRTGVVVVRTMEVVSFLVYIMACVNSIALLAGRAVARVREIRIRRVVGASTGRLLWQLSLEGLVITCIATICAIPLAGLALDEFERLVTANIAATPFWWSFDLSPRAVYIALAALPVGAVLVGWLPMLATAGFRPVQRSARRRSISRSLGLSLVLVESFIGVLLATLAMGFLRTLWDRTETSLGFDPANFVHAQIELPNATESPYDVFAKMVDDVEHAALAAPGFDGATVTDFTPGVDTGRARVRRPDGTTFEVNLVRVSDRFFDVAVPLADARQRAVSGPLRERQAIVTPQFSREIFGERRFVFESQTGPPWRVTGVVGDVTMGSGYQPGHDNSTVFIALRPKRLLSVLLRYEGVSYAGAVEEARRALAASVPGIEVFDVLPLREVIERNAAGMPMVARVLLGTAAVAAVFAFAGLIGVVGKHATQARREIGIRRSLGAQPVDIVLYIGGLTWMAIFVGVAASVGCSIYVQSLLAGVGMLDAAWMWDVIGAAIVLLIMGVAIATTVVRLLDDSPYGGVRER